MQESLQIKAMFDNIASKYDFLNHLLSLGQDFYWRSVMARELYPLRENSLVCDLATGTGDSAKVIAKRGFKVIGVDLSTKMLDISRKKLSNLPFIPSVGSAYELPFKDESFDAITCSFGIRNMHSYDIALKEIRRILKKGGKAIFLEFTIPQNFIKPAYEFYMKYILPNIAGLFSKKDAYEYLYDSIKNFPDPDRFANMLIDAGFVGVKQIPLSFGTVFVHKAFRF
ncbi:MAG: ubiquinone/menaquinone biosynthesis methyltransferase [Proteobacteria bacterium]|nr:ubiquinone/menaquinone biosynthesis methyltransferase [Pseudomonadota bacterium]